jgi:hypothetical protein
MTKKACLIWLCCISKVLSVHAQEQPPKIRAVDEINTAENEIAPSWYLPNQDSAIFYFERSKSWYLDDTGHVVMGAIAIPDSGFWKSFSTPRPLTIPDLPLTKYEVGPIWPNQGLDDAFFVGVSNLTDIFDSKNSNKCNIRALNRKYEVQKYYGPLDPVNSDNSWQSHPSASKENDIIFFSSDRPGGKGGLDLWYVVKTGPNTYSDPINDSELNTEYDEAYPSIDLDDASIIYFSSNRPRNGKNCGFDIYSAKREFREGENLQVPLKFDKPTLIPDTNVNSDYNDVCFVGHDSACAFFASDRPRPSKWATTNFDIYQVTPNPVPPPHNPKRVVSEKAILCDSTPVRFTVRCQVVDPVDNPNHSLGTLDVSSSGNVIGFFYDHRVDRPEGTIYSLIPEQLTDYIAMPSKIHFVGNEWISDKISLSPRKNPCPVQFLAEAVFDPAIDTPTVSSEEFLKSQLDSIIPYMKSLPAGSKVKVRTDGYTECRATTYMGNSGTGLRAWQANFDLSLARAIWVRNFCLNYIQNRVSKLSCKIDSAIGHGYHVMDDNQGIPFIDGRRYGSPDNQVPDEVRSWIQTVPIGEAKKYDERNRRVNVTIDINPS